MASLTSFGQRFPVVVQSKKNIVRAGNARLEAAKRLGWTHIAAIFVDESDLEATAFAIADNRTAELAGWDNGVLAQLAPTMQRESIFSESWFSGREISEILDKTGVAGLPSEGVNEVQDVTETRCNEGDLWVLGEHRLACGDSTDGLIAARLFKDERHALLITDPPYGCDWRGKRDHLEDWDGKGGREHEINADDSGADAEPVIRGATMVALEYADDKAGFYVFSASSWELSSMTCNTLTDVGWLVKYPIIWNKTSIVIGRRDYHSQFEPVWYGWRKDGSHVWYGDRKQSDVIDIPKPSANKEHPTMKPVELIERLIKNSTMRGQIVYDPFMGSGTTIMAAERSERRAYGIELSPGYCDVVLKRWENATGKEAVLEDPS
jgi:DNA modification methylase